MRFYAKLGMVCMMMFILACSDDDTGTAAPGLNAGTGAGSSGIAPNPMLCEDSVSFSACGGDLTGTWQVMDVCTTKSNNDGYEENLFAEKAGCSDAKQDMDMNFQGQMEFFDGEYSLYAEMTLNQNLNLSTSCMRSLADDADADPDLLCLFFEEMLDENMNEDEYSADVYCTLENDHCNCDVSIKYPDELIGSGSYEVSGTDIITSNSYNGEESIYSFCVDDEILMMQSIEDKEIWTMTKY